MVDTIQIAEAKALIGEPACAALVAVLIEGRALTATELAHGANMTPRIASGHLARLTEAHLLAVEKQGRHRYQRLASPEITRMLKSILPAASARVGPTRKIATGPRDAVMRKARTCYDHFAGGLGMAITDALLAQGAVAFDGDAGTITEDGIVFLSGLGIDMSRYTVAGTRSGRPLCRPCLDWSERRPHAAGILGAAICTHFFEKTYVRRVNKTRALEVTPRGRLFLQEKLGIDRL